jgi:hypothetical protein
MRAAYQRCRMERIQMSRHDDQGRSWSLLDRLRGSLREKEPAELAVEALKKHLREKEARERGEAAREAREAARRARDGKG